MKIYNYEKMSIIELVNNILIDASKRGAKNIQFKKNKEITIISIGLNNQSLVYTKLPNNIMEKVINRIKIISGINIIESHLPQSGTIKAIIEHKNVDFYVTIYPKPIDTLINIDIIKE